MSCFRARLSGFHSSLLKIPAAQSIKNKSGATGQQVLRVERTLLRTLSSTTRQRAESGYATPERSTLLFIFIVFSLQQCYRVCFDVIPPLKRESENGREQNRGQILEFLKTAPLCLFGPCDRLRYCYRQAGLTGQFRSDAGRCTRDGSQFLRPSGEADFRPGC
jgi:hypothetical protein